MGNEENDMPDDAGGIRRLPHGEQNDKKHIDLWPFTTFGA